MEIAVQCVYGSHMWSHTACGIETFVAIVVIQRSRNGHMWSHTACGIETNSKTYEILRRIAVTCDLIPLAVLKRGCSAPSRDNEDRHMWSHTACGIETNLPRRNGRISWCHMWSHTACGIETHGRIFYRDVRGRRHMWSHTACGIETIWIISSLHLPSSSHMWSHTACGIETIASDWPK